MSAQELITKHLDIWTSAHKTRSIAGRGSNNKLNLHGIKKLRELILELAVRGKLVPQDSNDEPANELLKKIVAEKEQLIKDGKLRKDKIIPDTREADKPFDIPSNWQWSKLSDISIINPRNSAEDELEASFVPMTLIDSRFDGGHEQELRQWKEIKQGFTHFAEGDIGVAKITPCFENSKACVFTNLTNNIGAGTTELHIVRPINNTLNSRYILACLKSPSFLLVGETKMTGTAGQKRLPKEFLESYPFALPPLAEQHRIVAKVDELMAFCDQLEQTQSDNIAAHAQLVEALLATLTNSIDHNELQNNWQRIATHFDTLFTTEHSIDQLKQTILQLAVMGKLVPQNLSDEPASELLKKIFAEKAQLIKEGKIKKQKELDPIGDQEKPFDLPIGWVYCRLDDICTGITSGSTPPQNEFLDVAGVPYLKVYNIKDQKIDFEYKPQFVSEECSSLKLKRSILYPGDVVMNIVGPPLGKIAIIPDAYPEWNCNQAITFFRPLVKELNFYIYTYLIAGTFLNDIELIGTAGQDNISVTKSRSIVLPMPPLDEQHRIVTKVDELMTLCDTLKANLQNAQTTQLALADALVEQAVG